MSFLTRILAIASLCLLSVQLSAHPMEKSRVGVRILEPAWLLDLQLPAERLEVAINLSEAHGEGGITPAVVRRYIRSRIVVRSSEAPDKKWRVNPVLATPPVSGEENFWQVQVELTPPEKIGLDKVEIEYRVIGGEIRTHAMVFSLLYDHRKSAINQPPIVLAQLRAHRNKLLIER